MHGTSGSGGKSSGLEFWDVTVSLDKTIAAKDEGGLGVGSVKALNIPLLVQWWWRLHFDPYLILSRAISGIQKLNSRHELLKLGIPLSDVITKTGNENSEGRRCNVFADGMYSVQTLRKKIDELTLVDLQKMEWEKEVPNKSKNGQNSNCSGTLEKEVHLDSIAFRYCNHEEECVDHTLANCSFARVLIEWIFKWRGTVANQFNTMAGDLDFAAGWGNCPKKRRLLLVICYGVL
uniref:Reverse transcriptase zinc-binding domain-containing protein n=1 Tax=Lactuca sativa TaxID=4236 RepID=A0A9R1WBS6_LACSA|nr:hypothetical protein LSAT_V11C200053710 [Lactuca sativa]